MRSRTAMLTSWLAFAGPLVAYLLTMPPGLTWANFGADGGDLITAAVTLGVPHPSGYPTYTLLGWLFSRLPLGPLAWRFNLLSAVAVAGAAYLVYRLIAGRTGDWWAGLIGAWSLAFTPLVWGQAIITEVYGVNLFFVALLLWLVIRPNPSDRIAFATGLAFGLALGTHLTVIFWLPVVVFWIFAVNHPSSTRNLKRQTRNLKHQTRNLKRQTRNLKHQTRNLKHQTRNLIFGFLLGASIFLYLPWRAGQGAVTWGRPDTLAGLWALVSGQLYRGFLFALPPPSLPTRLLALIGYLAQMGIVPLALAGIGLHSLWRYAKLSICWGAVSVLAYAGYAIGYKTADSMVYLLPVFMAMALAAGWGAAALGRAFPRRWPGFWLAMAVLLTVVFRAPAVSLRHDTAAETFYRQVLSQAPARAILLSRDDGQTFALWAAHFALGLRPDVTIVDERMVQYPWHAAELQRREPDLTELTALSAKFDRGEPIDRPLCRILETEQEPLWRLDCLP